jgi:hypothetical protein
MSNPTMPTLEAIQQDRLALTIAGAVTLANETLVARGVNPAACVVMIEEVLSDTGRTWRMQYGPRDFVHRRGGVWIVVVDEQAGVAEVIRGQ